MVFFADSEFQKACKSDNQRFTFCGVNAHHHNGIDERRIRTLRDSARSMLLLEKHHWPRAITTHLWPFALKYASALRQHFIAKGKSHSPIQLLSGIYGESAQMSDFHTFGCPVYNLDPKLKSEKNPSDKWVDRSRIGIYLGVSSEHASSISLILNPETGLTSSQFHIKHDAKSKTSNINISSIELLFHGHG